LWTVVRPRTPDGATPSGSGQPIEVGSVSHLEGSAPSPAAEGGGKPATTDGATVGLRDLFALFLRIGMSFGAGTGMSAVLQQDLVYTRHAIARAEFMTLYGLARLVPSGSMTALAVAIGYRYQGFVGTVAVLVAMILPAFVLTVSLTVVYTMLADSEALRIINLTLMPAALALVVVSSFRLGQEFLRPSVEFVLLVCAGLGVLFFGWNPPLVLLAGGVIGALTLRSPDTDRDR
jgi:chromate transport protein ChrA